MFKERGIIGGPVLTGSSYLREIARGNIAGASMFASFGEMITSGSVADHIIWPMVGTPTMPVPAVSGVQMSIVSTSANDSSSGTGIRRIRISYLDGNLNERYEIVTLNGMTPVLTAATNIRHIQRMHMYTYGSGLMSDGEITASNGGNIYSVIPIAHRQSISSVRRVPAGKKAFLFGLYGGSSSGSSASKVICRLVSTDIEGMNFDDDGIMFQHAGISLQDSSRYMSIDMPIPFRAGTIIGIEAESDKAATITGGFVGWLENE